MPDKYAAAECVNWDGFSVPQLWDMVAGEGHQAVFDQIRAWGNAHDALIDHCAKLGTYQVDLAQAWPPESSLAARACMDHVDKLTHELQTSAATAATNYEALHGIAKALSEAKTEMAKVHQQWQQKTQAQATESTAGKVLDTLTFWSDENAWHDELKTKATKIMVSTDAVVAQYRDKMEVPPPSRIEVDQPGSGQTTTGTGSTSTGHRRLTPPHIPAPTRPEIATSGHAGSGTAGPTLASIATTAPGTSPSADTSTGHLMTGGVIGAVPGIAAGVAIGSQGSMRTLGQAAAEQGVLRPVATTPAPLIDRNGVIGGRSLPAEPPAAAGRMRTVPSVIGEQPPPRGQSGMPLGGANTGAGAGGRDRKNSQQQFDPDTPWNVATGVTPVILPAPEPTEPDLGPEVIGRDR